MSAARRTLAVLTATALTVTACSGSGGGKHAGGASVTPVGRSAPKGTPVSPATLAGTVRKGLAGVRSVHAVLGIDLDGSRSTVTGDETLSGGRTKNLQVSTTDLQGTGPLRLLVVDGTTYAKLPKALNPTAKPYVLLNAHSKNAKLRQLASTVDFALGSVSLDRLASLLSAASSASRVGPATVGGVAAIRYGVLISVAKLPDTFPGKSIIQTVGLKTIPADLYLDSAGRPVQVSQTVKVSGHGVGVRIALSRYNRTVAIAAPPAGQVGTG